MYEARLSIFRVVGIPVDIVYRGYESPTITDVISDVISNISYKDSIEKPNFEKIRVFASILRSPSLRKALERCVSYD